MLIFLQRTALVTNEKLSNGQTIKKIIIVLSNRESKFKKPGDFKISFTLTNAGEAISTGIYTAQHCNCSKCPALSDTPYHLSGTISYYPNEKDTLGICSNNTATQVEIIELTKNEAIGSYNIIDQKTGARFKGTFTYPLAFF